MVSRTSLDVKGADGLMRSLKELPEEIASRLMVSALFKGADPIRDAAEDGAPEDTGILKASIKKNRTRKNLRRKGRAPVQVGVKRPASFYAHLVEYGTARGVTAQPFMRPAFDSKSGAAVSVIVKELKKGIKRTVRRLAKQGAKE